MRKDKAHEIKAVCVLHNETATGCLSPIAAIRKAIDAYKAAVEQGELQLHGAYFGVAEGSLFVLDQAAKEFRSVWEGE